MRLPRPPARPLLRLLVAALGLLGLVGADIGVGAVAANAAVHHLRSVAGDPVPAPNGVAGTDVTVSLPVAGTTRSYTVFVPDDLPPGPRPVVVMLHRYSGTPALTESLTDLDAGAASNGVLVVYPAGIGRSWNAGTCCGLARDEAVDDVGFLDAVLDDVQARFPVDSTRLAMGGFSNGGLMSYRYACERSDRVQTFFVGSGVPVAPSCSFGRPVGILHVHGLLDTTIPWLGTTTSDLFLNGIVPSVPSGVGGIAALDGCGGWATQALSSLVVRYTAQGCPSGASVTVLTSATMGHRWAVGPADRLAYGLDETGLTWSYVLSRWAH